MLLDYWLSGDEAPDVTNVLDLPEGIKRLRFSAESVPFIVRVPVAVTVPVAEAVSVFAFPVPVVCNREFCSCGLSDQIRVALLQLWS